MELWTGALSWGDTDSIWRVLTSSLGISSWTPLKPQHSNPNRLANQLWCIDFLTPPTRLIIPHRFPVFLESLMPLKNCASIHAKWSKNSLKHSIRFSGIFCKFKTQFSCILWRYINNYLRTRVYFMRMWRWWSLALDPPQNKS